MQGIEITKGKTKVIYTKIIYDFSDIEIGETKSFTFEGFSKEQLKKKRVSIYVCHYNYLKRTGIDAKFNIFCDFENNCVNVNRLK